MDKDYYDGLFDQKREVDNVTFSWNYLHDSWKASLSGSSESDTYNRQITYHHNWYQNCNSRLPLFRAGEGHIFNAYYEDVVSTAINSRIGACVRIEGNYFQNVHNPWVSAYSDVLGAVDTKDNILVNSPFDYSDSDTNEPLSCSLSIPYAYHHVLNSTSEVPTIVSGNAGVGVLFIASPNATGFDMWDGLRWEESLAIYPNPNEGRFTVSFELSAPDHLSIQLINGLGQQVKEIAGRDAETGKQQWEIETAGLPQECIRSS